MAGRSLVRESRVRFLGGTTFEKRGAFAPLFYFF